jgi:ribosomal protein S9
MTREFAQADFYDPDTFQIIVRRGEVIHPRQAHRLKELDFYEMAVEGEVGTDADRFKQRFGVLISIIPQEVQPNGWGKSKNALASVSITNRKGVFQINGVAMPQHMTSPQWQKVVLEPFHLLNLDPQDYAIQGYVIGGMSGERRQARAIAHALATALVALGKDATETESRHQSLKGKFIITPTPPNWR